MKKISFKEYLMEAPLPDDWDKSMYSNNKSFAKQIKYAKERAQQIGVGSSRVAFKIEYQGRPTVLKIAKNAKGLAQNQQESEILEDYYLESLNVAIPMIDYDKESRKPTWIHVEYAEKAKDSDFKKITGLSFKDTILFTAQLSGKPIRRYTLPSNMNENDLENNEFIGNLSNYFGNYDHPLADYTRLANWGVYKGNPVIIDIGMTDDIFKTYYS